MRKVGLSWGGSGAGRRGGWSTRWRAPAIPDLAQVGARAQSIGGRRLADCRECAPGPAGGPARRAPLNLCPAPAGGSRLAALELMTWSPPGSAVDWGTSNRPSDRAHGRIRERRLPPPVAHARSRSGIKPLVKALAFYSVLSLDAWRRFGRGGNQILRSAELALFEAQKH
jgi:hypothetical protein